MSQLSDNLLFASVDLPDFDRVKAAHQLLDLSNDLSYYDDYRHTRLLPLMTKDGIANREGSNNHRSGEFKWCDYTPTSIVDWVETYALPWLGMRTRIMALITKSGVCMNEHIDCSPNEMGTRQHKFRIVLQGNTNSLYFCTSNGNVHAPSTNNAFLIDGSWPHGMINNQPETKVTLAFGAPWGGRETYDNLEVLLDKRNYLLPFDLSTFWEKK